MTTKTITIIAAMARNRAIGLDGNLPWHLPGELQHFKASTMGKTIVMGRKTWESIGRVLPGRQNIVVTRNRAYEAVNCLVVASLEEAMEQATSDEVMLIGGGELYLQALPLAQRMILTVVDCAPQADTWFPEWEPSAWRELGRRSQAVDEHNPYAYEVLDLVRVDAGDR
jgi:dihydrofolate reductase